jgi:hypothetical protein
MSDPGFGSQPAKEIPFFSKSSTTSWCPPGFLFKECRELTLGWKSSRRMMLTIYEYIHTLMTCAKTAFPLPVLNQRILYFTVNFKCILLTHKMFITH